MDRNQSKELSQKNNFLLTETYQNIRKEIESNSFPWYLDRATDETSPLQFCHSFLYDNKMSNFISIIYPIMDKLKTNNFFRIKANLNWKTNKIIETGEHVDADNPKLKSSIYFLNTCDGYCRIEDKLFYSKENSLITFNANTIHSGSTTTNSEKRLLINFVYFDD